MRVDRQIERRRKATWRIIKEETAVQERFAQLNTEKGSRETRKKIGEEEEEKLELKQKVVSGQCLKNR